MQLKGKTALVTGGTSGIGHEIAKALSREGADVVITGRDATRGGDVVAEIERAGGSARFVQADLASFAAVQRLVEEVHGVDVLVNNAAVYPFAPTAEVDEATFDSTFAVNVKAPFFLVAALAPKMPRGGAIINISSGSAHRGDEFMATYGASKAALELLTKVWAAGYGPQGIRVNAVSPGPTRTRGVLEVAGDRIDKAGAETPLRRAAEPSEIASVVVFLARPEASYVHGALITADGGQLAV